VIWDHPETLGQDTSAAHPGDYISDLEGTIRATGDDADSHPIVPWVEKMCESRIDRTRGPVDMPSPSFSHSPHSHLLHWSAVAAAVEIQQHARAATDQQPDTTT
jgi:hypothetical protein